MRSGNELYVVLKLVSGEQVMAILKEEDEDRILLESPMCIRMIPVFETGREHVTAHPLCHFSDDRIFVIHKKDIMFCKKMHHMFIPQYLKIVKESEETDLVTNDREEKLNWEDETNDSERIKRAIDMLRSIAESKEEVKVSEKSTFVEGNDTIN